MTGNIALDVFIGLAFIYLLYSLYATVIVEIISSLLKLRARNLRTAITRMLMDADNRILSQWYYNISLLFRKLFNCFTRNKSGTVNQPRLIDIFFDQPTIKYLSKPGFIWKNKPSYIAPHSFSKALMDILKDYGTGNTLFDNIDTGIENCTIDTNTRNHIRSLLNDANNDLQKFKLLLERWFNDTMERSVGWFKRNNQFILFIIGILIAFIFNLNTIHIAQLLSKDSKAREQLVELAGTQLENYEGILNVINDSVARDATSETQMARLDSLLDIKKDLQADIKNTEILFGGGWNLPDKAVENVNYSDSSKVPKSNWFKVNVDSSGSAKTIYVVKPSESYHLDTTFFINSIKLRKVKIDAGNEDIQYEYQFIPFKYKWKFFWHNLLGYVLTTIAISLGSPFWFDLLNKLVKLRSSSRQPVTSEVKEGKNDTGTNPADNPLNRKG